LLLELSALYVDAERHAVRVWASFEQLDAMCARDRGVGAQRAVAWLLLGLHGSRGKKEEGRRGSESKSGGI
jgi:hypothetical protein